MTEAFKHHLCLREDEIRLVLEALDQYDPDEASGTSRRSDCEQLAALLRRGTGVSPELARRTDRPSS